MTCDLFSGCSSAKRVSHISSIGLPLFLALTLVVLTNPTLAQTATSNSNQNQPRSTESGIPYSIDSDLASSRWSGIFPSLASFNSQGECGTGAVVPWAERLWWVTYSPHEPKGSDDKLYSIDSRFRLQIYENSIGGTPANRMIHNESKQLFIGPYVIDTNSNVRSIPYSKMYGRPTGNARHLFDPANKIYLATMEEGIYEVDVKTLDIKELWRDEQLKEGRHANLPGYHGKGFYSGHGRVIYANNGEHGNDALSKPDIPSGVLATWDGEADQWNIVKRNQFTEVTGPNGIYGSNSPETDPIWCVGWDHRSLILATLAKGADGSDANWHTFRLPKASHAYDGAHGWNTEWPRIRDIGEDTLLMTMHGMFWHFPKTFSSNASAGIKPRSTYLKIVGDFCRWKEHIVLGCDDAAKAEFLNTRRAKGKLAGPAQSQSNLSFLLPEELDSFGTPIGRGAVWMQDSVEANRPSDPFMFSGFEQRSVHLFHDVRDRNVDFTFEVDVEGNGSWQTLETVTVPAKGYSNRIFAPEQQGTWIRVKTNQDCKATVWFEYRSDSERFVPVERSKNDEMQMAKAISSDEANPFRTLLLADDAARQLFSESKESTSKSLGAYLLAGDKATGLHVLNVDSKANGNSPTSYYQLSPQFEWKQIDGVEKQTELSKKLAVPNDILQIEGNSILYIDDDRKRYRLPIANSVFKSNPRLLTLQRVSREVTTERDLFQAAGMFYELPARNAGGFSKIRPIAAHPYFIHDYCSWRGLLVLSGIDRKWMSVEKGQILKSHFGGQSKTNADYSPHSQHVVISKDLQNAVWLGSVDDLWRLGKPTGKGGPWDRTLVKKDIPSDPYLMTGFDSKSILLSHESKNEVTIRAEIDITGSGLWVESHQWKIPAGKEVNFSFPAGFEAYWIRFISDSETTATVELKYE